MRGASGDDPDGDDVEESPGKGSDVTTTADGQGPSGNARDSSPSDGGARPPEADRTDAASAAGTDANGPDVTAPDDSVDPAEIDPSELTVSERSLHPRTRILWILRAAIWALVLGAIAFAITWQWFETGPLVPVAIAAVLLVLFVTHAILRYRAWSYEFREDAIYLERGVLTRVRTVVPFVRIQHVDTARGPIERAAGLSTLVVYTAGSRGADVTIPGIEAERATDHQRRLKQLAIAAEDDTAV